MKAPLYAIGSRIKSAREAANMSQADLAKKLNYKSPSTIARIESGENDLTQSKLSAFAAALGVPVGYLLGDVFDVTIHADAVRNIVRNDAPPPSADAERLRVVGILRGLQSDINAAFERAIADVMQNEEPAADKYRRIKKDLPKSDAG